MYDLLYVNSCLIYCTACELMYSMINCMWTHVWFTVCELMFTFHDVFDVRAFMCSLFGESPTYWHTISVVRIMCLLPCCEHRNIKRISLSNTTLLYQYFLSKLVKHMWITSRHTSIILLSMAEYCVGKLASKWLQIDVRYICNITLGSREKMVVEIILLKYVRVL